MLFRSLVTGGGSEAIGVGGAMGAAASAGGGSEGTSEAIDRSRVKLVQTPQTFLSQLLLPAYAAGYQEAFTDDAQVVEAAGHAVHLIEGETNNIKITTPEDLFIAGYWLKEGLMAKRD